MPSQGLSHGAFMARWPNEDDSKLVLDIPLRFQSRVYRFTDGVHPVHKVRPTNVVFLSALRLS